MKKKTIVLSTVLAISLTLLLSGCTPGGESEHYVSPSDSVQHLSEGIRHSFLVTAEEDLGIMKNILNDLKNGESSQETSDILKGKLEAYSQLRNENIYAFPDVYKEYNGSKTTSYDILPKELPKNMQAFGTAFSDYTKELKALMDQGAFDKVNNPDFQKKNGELLELVAQIKNEIDTYSDTDQYERNVGRMKDALELVESLREDIDNL